MKTLSRSRPRPVQPRNWQIQQLPGLSDQDYALLHACGIETTLQLCQQTTTAAARSRLASQLQIHPRHVNKWAALADLARIPSVGCQYCGLLLHAGISSPAQLAQMPIQRLHRQVLRLQVALMQRQDLCPSFDAVKLWIEQARALSAGC